MTTSSTSNDRPRPRRAAEPAVATAPASPSASPSPPSEQSLDRRGGGLYAQRRTPERPADDARGDGLRLTKAQRQHRIARILEQDAVASQAQLVDLLAADGVTATQATVSRDLEDMGAVKVRVPGGELVYAVPELPAEALAPEDHLRRVLGDWVVDVNQSLNLVVLRTPPGSAHVVASALDRSGIDEVIGTVAGDDTVLVVTSEHIGGKAAAARLRQLAGL